MAFIPCLASPFLAFSVPPSSHPSRRRLTGWKLKQGRVCLCVPHAVMFCSKSYWTTRTNLHCRGVTTGYSRGKANDSSWLRRVVWRRSACRRHTPPSPAYAGPGLCAASALLLLVSGQLSSTALTVTCVGKENDVKELKREQDGLVLLPSLTPSLPAPPCPRVSTPISTRHVPPPAHPWPLPGSSSPETPVFPRLLVGIRLLPDVLWQ